VLRGFRVLMRPFPVLAVVVMIGGCGVQTASMTISPISRSELSAAATKPATPVPAAVSVSATQTCTAGSASTPRTVSRWKSSQLLLCNRTNIS
jgi:hypothetical protein